MIQNVNDLKIIDAATRLLFYVVADSIVKESRLFVKETGCRVCMQSTVLLVLFPQPTSSSFN